MYFSYHTLIILLIYTINTSTGSKENNKENDKKNVNYVIPRRFIDDLTDDEWHVAHLKRPKENARKSGCKRTFEDLLKRYRKDMKTDAGAISFVSADPLPFNEKDLVDDSCKITDDFEQPKVDGTELLSNSTLNGTSLQKDVIKEESKEAEHPVTGGKVEDVLETVSDIVKLNITRNLDNNSTLRSNNSTEDDDLRDGVQVTVADEEVVDTHDKSQTVKPNLVKLDTFSNTSIFTSKATTKDDQKEDDKEQVRRSEYIFSSVEYYDEKIEFDPSTCPPDSVEVVIPELEMLKDYDVECILSLEWRCLE